jgi:hypothetical protein
VSSRPWWLAQLWVGAALLVGAIAYYSLVAVLHPVTPGPSIPFIVSATYFAPGLALSLGINGLILARRRSGVVSFSERVLLVLEFVVIALMWLNGLVTGPDGLVAVAFFVSFLLWLALLVLAPAVLIVECVIGRQTPRVNSTER